MVIYGKGINLWHHFARDGKRLYEKSAYETFPLKADTRYKLEVKRKGKNLEFLIDGHQMGLLVPSLSDELFVGVEGCEGVFRIMDFTVTP